MWRSWSLWLSNVLISFPSIKLCSYQSLALALVCVCVYTLHMCVWLYLPSASVHGCAACLLQFWSSSVYSGQDWERERESSVWPGVNSSRKAWTSVNAAIPPLWNPLQLWHKASGGPSYPEVAAFFTSLPVLNKQPSHPDSSPGERERGGECSKASEPLMRAHHTWLWR